MTTSDDTVHPHERQGDAEESAVPMVDHGGDVEALHPDGQALVDASASINPLGPPVWLRQEISRWTSALVHYPDPQCRELAKRIALYHGTSVDHVVVGNGSSELIAWLPHSISMMHWVVAVPSYGEYRRAPALAGRRVSTVPLGAAPEFSLDWQQLARAVTKPAVVFLGHPNNPTGTLLDPCRLNDLCRDHPDSVFIVDEAFAELADSHVSTWDPTVENRIVLRSLTKIAAIAGLRLGYALAAPSLAEALRSRLPPWSVNLLAQRVGLRLFDEPEWAAAVRTEIAQLRVELATALRNIRSIEVHEPPTNWLLVRLYASNLTASEVANRSRALGVAVRCCDDFIGLGRDWLRVSVRSREDNAKIVRVLSQIFGALTQPTPPMKGGLFTAAQSIDRVRPAKAIMLQGCSSDAGKSVLATALCRCLLQDGYRVAPFKAQNMSNNSGIGRDGGEVGRAQIVQATACGLDADTRMNPILLKPTSNRGAQVVLRGKAVGHLAAREYVEQREHCLETALQSFDELAAEYEVIVCEGAGSAGEINLRRWDIVNMGFIARRAMPALLVGDIDRGGVYASFVGHMEVMSEPDRSKVRGFLVNRFRGDESLLADAHEWLTYHTGRPVLGVVPFMTDLRLPGEDRLSLTSGRQSWGAPDAPIAIAVIAGPHVSNYTDIDSLASEADVYLRLVERPDELGKPDVVVWLGTKNTLADLEHFRRIGLVDAVSRAHAAGCEVVGICGGLQLLGQVIIDADEVESNLSQALGMGLLPICTTFRGDKVVRRCSVRHLPSGLTLSGYEIHHGATDFSGIEPLFVDDRGIVLGGGIPARRVWGSYLHGLFDNEDFRRHFVDQVRMRKGLLPYCGPRSSNELVDAIDGLADVFRDHVDLDKIYQIAGLEP